MIQMGNGGSLLKQFPEHTEIIRRMCVKGEQ